MRILFPGIQGCFEMSAPQVELSLPKLLRLWIVTSVFSPIMSEPHWSEQDVRSWPKTEPPVFDDISIREIDASVGQTLLLPCTVKNLGNKVVSWIRSKDLHILTSGRDAFSSDSRFEMVHSDSSGAFWGLRIRGVQTTDSGQYECQVNTEPKLSLALKLNVKENRNSTSESKWISQALIRGPGTVYVQGGSPVTFTCEISSSGMQSKSAYKVLFAARPAVRWLHDNQEIPSEFSKDNISVDTEYRDKDQRIFTRIHLPSVSWRDSGQYTCMQPSAKSDSVRLVVTEGEHSEAMQRDYPVDSNISANSVQHSSVLILICTYIFFT